MEETHQESLIKLRQDLKREEEKHTRRAVSEVREEEEERRHQMMQEQRLKERDRIQAAIEAERRVLESQQGSVSQLQKVIMQFYLPNFCQRFFCLLLFLFCYIVFCFILLPSLRLSPL